jgi:hypothetical protein
MGGEISVDDFDIWTRYTYGAKIHILSLFFGGVGYGSANLRRAVEHPIDGFASVQASREFG